MEKGKTDGEAVEDICEVIYQYPDESSPIVMEDGVNKNLDETHRDISEHDIETYMDATKMVIEKYPDGHGDAEGGGIKEKKVKYTEIFLKR